MSRIVASLLVVFCLPLIGLAQEAATPPADAGAAAPTGDAATTTQPAEGQAPSGDAANAGDPAAQPEEPSAAEATPPSPEAAAANEAFEALVDQWNMLIAQLNDLQQQRDAAQGDARAALETQMADVRKLTNVLVDKIADAGMAAYKIDALAFPRINATLLAIAQFLVIGDQHGDGGDQYERALPLVKGLIDAGAGDKWPQLYLLGGAAAYSVGDVNLAEDYLKKVDAAGLFANVPEPTGHEPPSLKLLIDSKSYLQHLPTYRRDWEAEQAIRAAEVKADDLPRVKFTTNKGEIVIELFENEAPQSVANFITLVKQGYYDGVAFHRVLPLFMAQGGDPDGTGGGGPGYNIPDEQRLPNARHHFRGSLSMANTGAPNSGGSQFFLTFVPTSYLDGGHAVFGRVIEGMDVAASLKRRDPNSAGPMPTPDKILKAEVLRDRGHEYKFEKLPE